MPTKRNKAGNQQNYVPKGNGDASGEYGDNATGSNKHFQVFAKGGGENKVDNAETKFNNTNIAVQPNNDKVKDISKNFDEYVDKNFSSDMAEGLKLSFNAGNEEQKEKLNYFASKGIIKIQETKGISYYGGGVALNTRQISAKKGSFSKEVGDVLYHEFGHAYDEFFAKGWVDDKGNKLFDGLITEEEKSKLASNYKFFDFFVLSQNLSTGKYLSNGKTLYETIQAEGKAMSRGKVWDQIISEYKQEIKDEVNKAYPDYYNNQKKLSDLRMQFRNDAEKLFPYSYDKDSNGLSYWEKRNNYIDDKMISPEVKELQEKITNDGFEVSKIERNILKKYSCLSDMYGIYKKIPYGFGSGHSGNYAKKNKGAIANEFFAEFNSSRARSDEFAKRQMELFEKYMPESTKMAKELFGLMNEAWKGIKQ